MGRTTLDRLHVANWQTATGRHDPSRTVSSLATRYGSEMSESPLISLATVTDCMAFSCLAGNMFIGDLLNKATDWIVKGNITKSSFLSAYKLVGRTYYLNYYSLVYTSIWNLWDNVWARIPFCSFGRSEVGQFLCDKCWKAGLLADVINNSCHIRKDICVRHSLRKTWLITSARAIFFADD